MKRQAGIALLGCAMAAAGCGSVNLTARQMCDQAGAPDSNVDGFYAVYSVAKVQGFTWQESLAEAESDCSTACNGSDDPDCWQNCYLCLSAVIDDVYR